jgi:hypothetical protein
MTAEAQGGFSAVERESEPESLCNREMPVGLPDAFWHREVVAET